MARWREARERRLERGSLDCAADARGRRDGRPDPEGAQRNPLEANGAALRRQALGATLEDDPDSEVEPPPPYLFVRIGLVFYGLMALAAVVWREGYLGQSIWQQAPAGPALIEPGWPLHAALGLGVGLVVALLSQWMTRATGWGDALGRGLAEAMGELGTADALLLAFASGLAEEMLFRGAVQPHWGLVATSLLFGAIHFVPRREMLPWTVFAVAAGFLLGWLYQLTGSLTAPVVAHIVINGLNLPFLVRRYREAAGG